MELEHINCTKGAWTIHRKLGLITGHENINIANFKNDNIPESERYLNMLLSATSKLMCFRINQVSKMLKHKISQPDPVVLREVSYKQHFRFWKMLLQSTLPAELRIDNGNTDRVSELLEMVNISLTYLDESEREQFLSRLIQMQ